MFSLRLPTIDHELRGKQCMILEADAALQRVPTISLKPDDIGRLLDVQTFEWDSDDNPRGSRFSEVWAALEESVAQHWHAPYMPRLVHVEPDEAIQQPSRAAGRSDP